MVVDFLEGRPSVDPQAGEATEPMIFSQSTKTSLQSAWAEGSMADPREAYLWHIPYSNSEDNRCYLLVYF